MPVPLVLEIVEIHILLTLSQVFFGYTKKAAIFPPKNISKVKCFLGFVQFFHKSLKDLAAISYPLT